MGGCVWGLEGLDPFLGPAAIFDRSPAPRFLFPSATVSAAVVPSAPIFSPAMGGGSNSSLSLDSGGAEPMPGGYLTPDPLSPLP